MFGGLEKTCGETHWRFGGDVFGDLEKAYSVISERPVRRFWRFGENLFDEIVVGDLEKTFGDFGENRLAILEIVMEYCNAR